MSLNYIWWSIIEDYCQNINIYFSAKNDKKNKTEQKTKTKNKNIIEEMKIKTKQYINFMWYDKNNHY